MATRRARLRAQSYRSAWARRNNSRRGNCTIVQSAIRYTSPQVRSYNKKLQSKTQSDASNRRLGFP